MSSDLGVEKYNTGGALMSSQSYGGAEDVAVRESLREADKPAAQVGEERRSRGGTGK